MNLRWHSSIGVSCLYAMEAWFRRPPKFDAVLAEVLAEPARKLQAALKDQLVPAEQYWLHAVPLAANIDSFHQLAEVALVKTIGRQEAESRAPLFRNLLTELREAFVAAIPRLSIAPVQDNEALQQEWNYYGTGVLGRIASWIEAEFLVEEAVVLDRMLSEEERPGAGS